MIWKKYQDLNNSLIFSVLIHFIFLFIMSFLYNQKPQKMYIPVNITSIVNIEQKTEEKTIEIEEKNVEIKQTTETKVPAVKEEVKEKVKEIQKIEIKKIEETKIEKLKEEIIEEKKDDYLFGLSSNNNEKIDGKKTEAIVLENQESIRFEQNFEFVYYAKIIKNKIAQNWKVYFLKTRQAKCVIFFKIKRNGQIVDVAVQESSGILEFDIAGKKAVLDSNSFPNLPDEYKEDSLNVYFTFYQQ